MPSEKSRRRGVSRRHLLQAVTGGTAATIVGGSNLGFLSQAAVARESARNSNSTTRSVRFERSRLPVLATSDVVVIGGSIAAVAAALEFARGGQRVVLVEHRNYLGREVSATLKPWVDLVKLSAAGAAAEPIRACLKKTQETMTVGETGGEIPLWMDAFKVTLEDLLLEARVQIVYASLPTEAILADGAIRGVVIGNKSGRQAVLGRLVVDATSTALVARLAGADFEPETVDDFHFVRMMELDGVGAIPQTTLTVPADLGITDNKLTVHYGYRGKQHVLIECPMDLPMGKMDLDGMMAREIEARHRSMRVAAYLIQNVSAFKAAKLGICGFELDGLQTTQLSEPSPSWAQEFKGLDLDVGARARLPLADFAGPVKGLWCLDEAARLQPPGRALLRDPVDAALVGAAFGKLMLPRLGSGEIRDAGATDYQLIFQKPHGLEVNSQDTPQRGRFFNRLIRPPLEVPVSRETDVLVVGAGTSGAICASAAGREGVKTAILELCSGLGGTATVGGVCAHWWGRYWDGFSIRTAKLVDEVHKTINWPTITDKVRRKTASERWNIEAKMYALLKDALASGVEVFYSSTTIAAVLRDNRVCGVVAATPYGPTAILSKVTADTTGDGDVAAFAGARYFYGARRDHYPMWYNLAQFIEPTESRWHFSHQVDVSNIDDYTRAILIGRRRGPTCHDHGCYIATRESRHIIGDVLVTLTDLLRHRPWPDVVNLGAGQMDCHRRVASDWIRIGLLFPILPTEMPYRALLPQGLDNILVAGKAFSGAHDALYTLRNQPDLENLGGAVGVAAAYAVRDGVTARQVDLRKLQKRLAEIGTLLPEMLTREVHEEPHDEAAIRAFVQELDGRHFSAWEDVQMAKEDEPGYRKKIPIVEICTADPALAVPILEKELAHASGDRKTRLAQALAMFGSKAAVPTLVAAIEHSIEIGAVRTEERRRWPVGKKNEGVPQTPSDLVYSLGMTRDPRALAVWDKVASLIKGEPEEFAGRELPWPFHYVDSICYGAELLGDQRAIPILERLHNLPLLRNQSVEEGFQVDFDLEKRALIELTLGRTLASLGSPEGYDTLIDYLDDNRANLAEFAHMTLEELTERDCGKDSQAWRQWLVNAKSSLETISLLERVNG